MDLTGLGTRWWQAGSAGWAGLALHPGMGWCPETSRRQTGCYLVNIIDKWGLGLFKSRSTGRRIETSSLPAGKRRNKNNRVTSRSAGTARDLRIALTGRSKREDFR